MLQNARAENYRLIDALRDATLNTTVYATYRLLATVAVRLGAVRVLILSCAYADSL